MIFEIDEQTKKDLNIYPSNNNANSSSVFTIFNKTKTGGGSDLLLKTFKSPLNDISQLEERRNSILFVQKQSIEIAIDYKQFEEIEFYFRIGKSTLQNTFIDSLKDRVSYWYDPTSDYYNIQNGIFQLYKLHLEIKRLLLYLKPSTEIPFFDSFEKESLKFISIFKNKIRLNKKGEIYFRNINKLDFIFRKQEKDFIREYINSIYSLDVFIAISSVMKEKKFTFPEYYSSNNPSFKLNSVWHPFIENPVKNSIELGFNHNNILFLTGPNMAGKSTFLKSIGISLYLAHLGFPVPAKEMQLVISNSLSTTINLSDNINSGQSHYFSEVKRVKDIAQNTLKKGKSIVIIDELFRGTNVKDALEASYKLINEFVKIKSSLFIISSHINEISNYITPKNEFSFQCFSSKIVTDKIQYDYQLKSGISSERMGLKIIEQEQIFKLLEELKTNQK